MECSRSCLLSKTSLHPSGSGKSTNTSTGFRLYLHRRQHDAGYRQMQFTIMDILEFYACRTTIDCHRCLRSPKRTPLTQVAALLPVSLMRFFDVPKSHSLKSVIADLDLDLICDNSPIPASQFPCLCLRFSTMQSSSSKFQQPQIHNQSRDFCSLRHSRKTRANHGARSENGL